MDEIPPASHFRFQDLPKDIRWMVYDYLPEQAFRSLLENNGVYFFHFASWKMPAALLRVNKFFHNEVSACLRQRVELGRNTLLCRHTPASWQSAGFLKLCIPTVEAILRNGRLYDTPTCQTLSSRKSSGTFDHWTLKAPMLHLKIHRENRPWTLTCNGTTSPSGPSYVKVSTDIDASLTWRFTYDVLLKTSPMLSQPDRL